MTDRVRIEDALKHLHHPRSSAAMIRANPQSIRARQRRRVAASGCGQRGYGFLASIIAAIWLAERATQDS
ncbi:MAG: hypothetical protein IH966_02425 [Gemmatimonadetes bacterium]|nr:hypothetical protein [Gemmatimonadota bacterium]